MCSHEGLSLHSDEKGGARNDDVHRHHGNHWAAGDGGLVGGGDSPPLREVIPGTRTLARGV